MAPAAKFKESPPFVTLSKKESLGWSLVLLVLFGAIFFWGVLVGRGSVELSLYPTDLQKELMAGADRKDVVRFDGNGGSPVEKRAPAEVTLSFYKEMKESQEQVTKRRQVVKAEAAVVAPESARRPLKEKAPTPSSLEPFLAAPPASGYTIQVAAHALLEAAEKEKAQLKAHGFSGYVISAKDKSGKTWYRVRVGRFREKETAQKELAKLAAVKKSAYVVKM